MTLPKAQFKNIKQHPTIIGTQPPKITHRHKTQQNRPENLKDHTFKEKRNEKKNRIRICSNKDHETQELRELNQEGVKAKEIRREKSQDLWKITCRKAQVLSSPRRDKTKRDYV